MYNFIFLSLLNLENESFYLFNIIPTIGYIIFYFETYILNLYILLL